MKKLILFIAIFILIISCQPNVTIDNGDSIINKDFYGSVFKGPFLVSSTVNIYPLDENLTQTGASYSGTIISSDGSYDISDVPVSGLIELVADGYFFNEVSNSVTDEKMTMRAITNKSGVVNINILTALEFDRVKYLYNNGSTLSGAKMQAAEELFEAFGLNYYGENCDEIGLNSANVGELLTISACFAGSETGGSRTPAEIEQLITLIRVDFRDGSISDSLIDQLKNSAKFIDSDEVRLNLSVYFASIGSSLSVPDFGDVLNGFAGFDDISGYTADSENWIQVPQVTTQIVQGHGRLDGFTLASGTTLTLTVTGDDDNKVRMYSGNGFVATSDFHSATASGPGYVRLDWGALYPDSVPYTFTVTVDDGTNTDVLTFTVVE